MTWSVRLSLPGRHEYGDTGINDAQLAQKTYESFVARIKKLRAGKVELMKDGEVVASFELPEAKS